MIHAPSIPRWALAAALALLSTCRSGEREKPLVTSIEPSRALEGASLSVTIRGERLTGRAYTDFESASGSHLDTAYLARLGPAALREVKLARDGVLTAVVPEGMAPGIYDLAVTDPWGREAVLPGGFEVVSSAELDRLVTGFRIAALPAQRAFSPFSVTITAVDAKGEQVPYFNGAVSLTDSTGTAVPAQVGAFAFGAWTGLVEVRRAHPADVLTVGDALGRTGQSEPFAVAGREPARLRFASAPQRVLAGGCSAKVSLQLLDRGGFEVSAPAPLPLSLTPTPSADFALYADAACSAPLIAPVLAEGASTLMFYFRSLRAGVVQLGAGAAPIEGDRQLEVVSAAAAERVVFTTAAQARVAGTCSGLVRLESQDAQGNAAPVLTRVDLALTSSPDPGLSFYADAACSAPLSALAIDPGGSTTSFYFSGVRANTFAMAAQAGALGAPWQPATILPAAPDHLVFTTAPQALVAGVCSARADLELRDRFENAAPAAASGAIALTSDPAVGLALFRAPGCADPASSVELAAGAAGAGFFFRGSAAGDYTVAAALPGAAGASQLERVHPPLADRLAFLGSPQSIVAGTCSGLVTVESHDAEGVPRAPATDQVIALFANPAGALAFFSDSACKNPIPQVALPAGELRARFYVSGTRAGEPLAVAGVAGWTPGTQAQVIGPGVGDRIGFLSAPLEVPAGECSPTVAVAVEDKYENPSPVSSSAVVSLAAAPPDGFQLFLDAGCTMALSSLPIVAGTAWSEFHFRGTRASSVVVFAASGGLKSASQSEVIRAKVPDRLTFMTPPRSLAAGTCSGILTVQAQDMLGNPVAVDVDTPVVLASNAPPDLAFYADGSCAIRLASPAFAMGSDSLSFYMRATTAGAYSARIQAFNATAAQAVAVSPGPTAKLAWDPIPVREPGGVPFEVALRARDGFDNPTPDFAGAASILLAPHGACTCTRGCAAANTTSAFASGAWFGAIRVDSPGAGLELVAVTGPISAPSSPFDVLPPPAQSAPQARLAASPGAVLAGAPASLDASGSLDYQTPTAELQTSFDPSGTAAGAPPWTPFAAGLSANPTFSSEGLFFPRAAVRDADGLLGYASAPVAVVASADDLCTVTTPSLEDDGAASCGGPFGNDGRLSLAEALRLLSGAATPRTITFAGPMTVSGAGPLALSRSASLVGGAGVVLQVPLEIGAGAFLGALTFRGATLTVLASGDLTGYDLSFDGGASLVVRGSASLSHLAMEGCPGACIADEGSRALSVRFASLRSSPSAAGIAFRTCAPPAAPAQVQSAVFQGLLAGVRDECGREVEVRHATFEGNGQGMALSTAAGNVLEDSIFSNQSGSAVDCGSAGFSSRQRLLLWANASDGCLARDPGNASGDPLYAFPEAGDFRVLATSPAVDAAPDLGLDVNAEGPGLFFGAAPDLGGLESH